MRPVAIPEKAHPLEWRILNALFDAGTEMTLEKLRRFVPVPPLALNIVMQRQVQLGNIEPPLDGQPIRITRSCRDALAAGRAAREVRWYNGVAPSPGGTAEGLGRTIDVPVRCAPMPDRSQGVTVAFAEGAVIIGVHSADSGYFARLDIAQLGDFGDAFIAIVELLEPGEAVQ
jgi:hypothetical protein